MLLPPPTAPLLRGLFTRLSSRASHKDPRSLVQRSRVDCRNQLRILNRWEIGAQSVDVDQAFGDDYAGDTDALFDMVDRNAVQIQFPATADIAAQGKTASVRDKRTCFVDSAIYR